jgi:hypothetical protein
VHVGSWGETLESGYGLGNIVVCSIDIVIFTCQNAIKPVQDMLGNGHCRCMGRYAHLKLAIMGWPQNATANGSDDGLPKPCPDGVDQGGRVG